MDGVQKTVQSPKSIVVILNYTNDLRVLPFIFYLLSFTIDSLALVVGGRVVLFRILRGPIPIEN